MQWTICRQDPYRPHAWFAWFPVKVSSTNCHGKICTKRVWLKHVQRQRFDGRGGWWTAYTELPQNRHT